MFVLSLESSHARGMGHLYRGLVITNELTSRGHDVLVLINEDEIACSILLKKNLNFQVVNYNDLTGNWEKEIIRSFRPHAWINDRLSTTCKHVRLLFDSQIKSFTFDDHSPCSSLYDINFCPLSFSHNVATNVLSGLQYLPVHPKVLNARRCRRSLDSVVISLGGADTHGITPHVLDYINLDNLRCTVILGPSFADHQKMAPFQSSDRITIKSDVPCLIDEFKRHDLAITAGGITPVEAASMGLPSLIIATEPHEITVAHHLASIGVSAFLGYRRCLTQSVDLRSLDLESMSIRSLEYMDGCGTNRVVDLIETSLVDK